MMPVFLIAFIEDSVMNLSLVDIIKPKTFKKNLGIIEIILMSKKLL